MLDFKFVADVITFTRGLFGLWMVFLGLTLGRASLPSVIVLMILCWTGDYIDGRVARLSSAPKHSWIGDHDIQVDILVSLCVGAYLILTSYISWLIGVIYLVFWVYIFKIVGLNHGLLMLVQAPMYALLISAAMHDSPQYGRWLLFWLIGVVIINRRRFFYDIIPGFLRDFRDSIRQPRVF